MSENKLASVVPASSVPPLVLGLLVHLIITQCNMLSWSAKVRLIDRLQDHDAEERKMCEDLFIEFLVRLARSLTRQQKLGINVLMIPSIRIINLLIWTKNHILLVFSIFVWVNQHSLFNKPYCFEYKQRMVSPFEVFALQRHPQGLPFLKTRSC